MSSLVALYSWADALRWSLQIGLGLRHMHELHPIKVGRLRSNADVVNSAPVMTIMTTHSCLLTHDYHDYSLMTTLMPTHS